MLYRDMRLDVVEYAIGLFLPVSHLAPAAEMNNMSDIIWPEGYWPGFTDNFASNEIVVPHLSAQEVWPYLVDTRFWPTYYSNVSEIRFHEGSGPKLSDGARFGFTTFGFPVDAEIVEFVQPAAGQAARLAWHGWSGEAESRGDAHHAWLFEDLPGGRVRLLTRPVNRSMWGLRARSSARRRSCCSMSPMRISMQRENRSSSPRSPNLKSVVRRSS